MDICIPREIWLDKSLSWGEKFLYAEIVDLDQGKGCFASDDYLARFFSSNNQKISPSSISRMIRHLASEGYVKIKEDGKRRLTPKKSPERIEREEDEKDTRKSLRDLFFRLYRFKVKNLTGRVKRDDGKPINPFWSGKQGSLLKDDYENLGYSELKRMMLLFFSDQIKEVADFTRYTNKAGYGYEVFHGMISKMIPYDKKPLEPCWECGKYRGHFMECSKKVKMEAEIRAEEEEFKPVEGLDIFGMFKDKLKSNANANSHLQA